MKLLEIFHWIVRAEQAIGYGARVKVFTHLATFPALTMRVTWPNDLTYQKVFGLIELETYMLNDEYERAQFEVIRRSYERQVKEQL